MSAAKKKAPAKKATKKAAPRRVVSQLEETLALQIRAYGLPTPEREYKFHPTRRWRFDFAWPAKMLAVEVDGGAWIRGRHSRPEGQMADREKGNAALSEGWRVLRFGAEEVHTGEAALLIASMLREVE